MATNNLTENFTETAKAIRAKKGTTAKISPQDFPSEIASIPSGGGATFYSDTMTVQLGDQLTVYEDGQCGMWTYSYEFRITYPLIPNSVYEFYLSCDDETYVYLQKVEILGGGDFSYIGQFTIWGTPEGDVYVRTSDSLRKIDISGYYTIWLEIRTNGEQSSSAFEVRVDGVDIQ